MIVKKNNDLRNTPHLVSYGVFGVSTGYLTNCGHITRVVGYILGILSEGQHGYKEESV